MSIASPPMPAPAVAPVADLDETAELARPTGTRLSRRRVAARPLGAGSVAVAGALLLPTVLTGRQTFLASSTLIYAIVLLGFVVLYGWLGQVSFCQAELMGVGAFTAAALTSGGAVPAWLAVVIAIMVTIPTAMVVAVPSLRLSGFNVSLATLAFAVAMDSFVLNTQTVSRLDIGRSAARPVLWGEPLSDTGFYYLAGAAFLACAGLLVLVRRSNVGRSFHAVQDSEVAAAACGIAVWRYKLAAWALAATFAAIGGSLLAFSLGIVNFRPFGVTQALFLFAVAVIGGVRSPLGALLGATFFIGVPEALSYVETTGRYTFLFYGLGVVLAMVFFPRGVTSIGERVAGSFARRSSQRQEVDA
jgi:branched-chain amino acid transport system permease protein